MIKNKFFISAVKKTWTIFKTQCPIYGSNKTHTLKTA